MSSHASSMARRRMGHWWGWRSYTFHLRAEKLILNKVEERRVRGRYRVTNREWAQTMPEPPLHGGSWHCPTQWHKWPFHLDKPAQFNWETQWGVQSCRSKSWPTSYHTIFRDSCAHGDVSPTLSRHLDGRPLINKVPPKAPSFVQVKARFINKY
jgi:hypothetical protein